jgi:hypothetical protein
MKRLAVGLFVVIIICMLVVAGPAAAKKHPAAVVFHGTWTGGSATQMAPPDGTGDVVDLEVSGPDAVFVFGAHVTTITGSVVCAVVPDAPPPPSDPGFWGPFPLRWQMAWFKWDPATWDGSSYTVTFDATIPIIPPFTGTLVATPADGTFTIHVNTVGSAWGWETWDLYGELK